MHVRTAIPDICVQVDVWKGRVCLEVFSDAIVESLTWSHSRDGSVVHWLPVSGRSVDLTAESKTTYQHSNTLAEQLHCHMSRRKHHITCRWKPRVCGGPGMGLPHFQLDKQSRDNSSGKEERKEGPRPRCPFPLPSLPRPPSHLPSTPFAEIECADLTASQLLLLRLHLVTTTVSPHRVSIPTPSPSPSSHLTQHGSRRTRSQAQEGRLGRA